MATTFLTESEPIPAVLEPLAGNYFIAAYPPFSCWNSAAIADLDDVLNAKPPAHPVGIYVHVPFCQKKCDYCYYLSYIGQPASVVNGYLDAVLREAAHYATRPALRDREVSFVYFGGGTPSALSTGQLRHLIRGLKTTLPWRGVQEVTFECAPRSVRSDFLAVLRDLGVTRLSMGVQSFDNDLLKRNGRVHLSEDVERAYTLIRDAGFEVVNLDLMVGLMGETWETWRATIRRVLELCPDSVTIYQTEIPYNTQLYRDLKRGCLPAPPISWELKRARLDEGFTALAEGGYTVVSAYAAIKDPDRHRFLYQDYLWRGGDMLGLGVASFGYLGGIHYQNDPSLLSYQANVSLGQRPITRAFHLNARDRMVREFILQLKLGEVRMAPFQRNYGTTPVQTFAGTMAELAAEGLLTFAPDKVRLTADGMLCVDRLLPRFYDPQYREQRYT